MKKSALQSMFQPMFKPAFRGVSDVDTRGAYLADQVVDIFTSGGAASPGAFYYHTASFSASYQDPIGSLPVSALNQSVGLVLDRRFNLARGNDIAINGDFAAGSTGWTTYILGTGTVTFAGGAVQITGTDNANRGGIEQAIPTVVGNYYEVTYTTQVASGSFTAAAFAGPNFTIAVLAAISSTSLPRFIFRATGTTSYLAFRGNSLGVNATIDNVVIRNVPGNHALQATAANRPLLQKVFGNSIQRTFDGTDSHVTSFPAALGANCTVGRAIPGVGAQILTAQTVGTSFTDTTTSSALVIFDRALTGDEALTVYQYLQSAAGMAPMVALTDGDGVTLSESNGNTLMEPI